MKRKLLLLLLSPLLLATTCDDDPNYPHIGLQGEWQLVRISNGFAGTSHDFEEGLISWTFSESYHSVYVTNNNEEDVYDGLSSQNYNYDIRLIPDVCDKSLTVEDTNFGCVIITGDTLRLSSSHLDGDVLTFAR